MNRIYPLLLSVIISFACSWSSAKQKVVHLTYDGHLHIIPVSDIDSISVIPNPYSAAPAKDKRTDGDATGKVAGTLATETAGICAALPDAPENYSLNLLDADMNITASFSLDKPYDFYFGSDYLSISSSDEGSGIRASVPYDCFRLITFSSAGSGISEVSIDEKSDISIMYDRMSETLAVTAANAISDIQIYDMRGVCLCHLRPARESASVSVGDVPPGIYVIKIVAGNNVYTRKIAKH